MTRLDHAPLPLSLDSHAAAIARIDLCSAAGTALYHRINGNEDLAESYLRAHVPDPAALGRIVEAAQWLALAAERVRDDVEVDGDKIGRRWGR